MDMKTCDLTEFNDRIAETYDEQTTSIAYGTGIYIEPSWLGEGRFLYWHGVPDGLRAQARKPEPTEDDS